MSLSPASIRVRLTLWYSLVLASGMALFGGGVWLVLRQALYSAVQEDLAGRVAGTARRLIAEMEEHAPPAELRAEMAEYTKAVPEGYRIALIDPAGRVVLADSPQRAGPIKRLATTANGFRIEASASLEGSNRILDGMTWRMLAFAPVFILLAAAGGYALARRALRPVDKVTEAARSITIRNLSQRLAVPATGDEIERMSVAWNEALSRLDAAVHRLAQFTADASHELRTPVALIRTAAELALRRERAPEDYRRTLRQIADESERTSRLIDDLLALARADAGLMPMPVAELDLAALVLEVGERSRPLAVAHDLSLETEVPEEPVALPGNEAGLRRLLSVIVDNAVKYTPAGGAVRLRLARDAQGAAVEIRDTGVGMAPDVVPHIFERFYRADESRNRDTGGSGLGLSIAKWIADCHSAAIQVESVAGQGSVFRVLFPRAA